MYLYERQVSILITGVDEWRYSAFTLVDNLLDRNATTKPGRVLQPDPITNGRFMVDDAMRMSPRSYFLKTLAVWLDHIGKEWQEIVHLLDRTIRKIRYVTTLSQSMWYLLN